MMRQITAVHIEIQENLCAIEGFELTSRFKQSIFYKFGMFCYKTLDLLIDLLMHVFFEYQNYRKDISYSIKF